MTLFRVNFSVHHTSMIIGRSNIPDEWRTVHILWIDNLFHNFLMQAGKIFCNICHFWLMYLVFMRLSKMMAQVRIKLTSMRIRWYNINSIFKDESHYRIHKWVPQNWVLRNYWDWLVITITKKTSLPKRLRSQAHSLSLRYRAILLFLALNCWNFRCICATKWCAFLRLWLVFEYRSMRIKIL